MPSMPPLRFVRGLHHPIAGACPMHRHRDLEIVFHPTGAGRTTGLHGEAMEFAEGDVVLYPPGAFHDQDNQRAGEDLCVQVALPARAPAVLRRWRTVAADAYARSEIHLLSHLPPPTSAAERQVLDLRVTALVAHLLTLPAADGSTRRAGDRLAERARRHIAEHCTNLGSLEGVAAVCGCSPDRLRHAFTARYGISMVRWLSECRIARAKDLLLHAPLGLAEVAIACGYGSTPYFSTAFRTVVGDSPMAWRARHRPLLTPAS